MMCESSTEDLQQQLQDSQHKCIQAAQYGQQLLQENEELHKRLEEYEQEKYTLLAKIQQKSSTENWYNEEITDLKEQLKKKDECVREVLEAEKQIEVARYVRQVEELKADLEHQSSIENQLREKITDLEELVKQRLNNTNTEVASLSFSQSEEVSCLLEEKSLLENEVTSLKSQLIERNSEVNRAQGEIECLQNKLCARQEEIENIQCQYTAINNVLEKCREENVDLKCQMDVLQMEGSQDRGKGNSIFSEVNDRRVDAEKMVVTLQVTNKSLQDKYNQEKQQNIKYKRQISQLLLMSTGRVEREYVSKLETQLTQAREETRQLLRDHEHREQQVTVQINSVEKDKDQLKVSSDNITQYLQTVIESKEQEIQNFKGELNAKTLCILDLRSRRSNYESKILDLEAMNEKLRNQNISLTAKLEDMKDRYEPDSTKAKKRVMAPKVETLPVDDAVVSITDGKKRKVTFSKDGTKNMIEPVKEQGTDVYVKDKSCDESDVDRCSTQ